MTTAAELKTKSLSQIAKLIYASWPKVHPTAAPYLDAMTRIESINDKYYADSAYSVVAYFISNSSQFKGEEAKLFKAELKDRMKQYEKAH